MSYGEPKFDPYQNPQHQRGGHPQQPWSNAPPEGATPILVCGILSLVACAPLGIAAWVMGNTYIAKCRRLNVQPDSTATAGRICGIIGTVLFGLQMAFFVIFGILAVVAASAN